MSQLPPLEPGQPIPDMPPSRPTVRLMLGTIVVVLAIVALMHEHQLLAFMRSELFG